ncbi:hypothetical protein BHM03_00052327 [Ensete ventricosum]|nr:hypothetical protein BHM03_00052327 [Ensete ventricosum]
MGCRTSTVLQKNSAVIDIVRCHTHSRVSIGFSCTVLKIQNTGHSRRISPPIGNHTSTVSRKNVTVLNIA